MNQRTFKFAARELQLKQRNQLDRLLHRNEHIFCLVKAVALFTFITLLTYALHFSAKLKACWSIFKSLCQQKTAFGSQEL